MKRIVFVAFLYVAVALVWAFRTRDKVGMLIFFLGAALLLCTLAVGGARLTTDKTPPTNTFAILGALIGLFLGGLLGAKSGFGRVMISIFNPGLPELEFGEPFGAIGGGILGAFVLALLCGIQKRFTARSPEDSQVSDREL